MRVASAAAGALGILIGSTVGSAAAADAPCALCEKWNAPQEPFRIHGDTYYVGPHGLSAILVTSPSGHVVIDGGLPESAEVIARNIGALGFKLRDVKLILGSHAHWDHAGGIAELQRRTGARVAASAWSARVLESGQPAREDPQYGGLPSLARVKDVRVVRDGETVRLGPLRLTAHLTPGHTPGGTSWTWQSCAQEQCVDMVYADSLTAVSAENFRFTANTNYPQVLEDFARSFAVIGDRVSCSVLLTPHPEASGLWDRLARRDAGEPDALVDTTACRDYADKARRALERRVARERGEGAPRETAPATGSGTGGNDP